MKQNPPGLLASIKKFESIHSGSTNPTRTVQDLHSPMTQAPCAVAKIFFSLKSRCFLSSWLFHGQITNNISGFKRSKDVGYFMTTPLASLGSRHLIDTFLQHHCSFTTILHGIAEAATYEWKQVSAW